MNAYSLDLREKIVTTYEGGNTSIRKVARRFQVSKGVVQNLINLKRRTGELRPKKATGGRKSQLAGREEELALMVEEHPDYTLAEYCEYFGEKTGIRVSQSTMCRALDKQNLTRKKKIRRSHQGGTEENQCQRVEYWEKVREIDVENLVFLDEMGTAVGLARLYGRSFKGQKLYDLEAIYRGKNLTSIGAISLKKVLAFETLTKAMNGEEFKKFLREQLILELWKGAVLIMDNLSAHKVEGVEEMLREVGVKVIYLSPYSPEFNPIEHLWSELKSFVRRFAPKTEEALKQLLKLALLLVSEKSLKNYFTPCCYCTS